MDGLTTIEAESFLMFFFSLSVQYSSDCGEERLSVSVIRWLSVGPPSVISGPGHILPSGAPKCSVV